MQKKLHLFHLSLILMLISITLGQAQTNSAAPVPVSREGTDDIDPKQVIEIKRVPSTQVLNGHPITAGQQLEVRGSSSTLRSVSATQYVYNLRVGWYRINDGGGGCDFSGENPDPRYQVSTNFGFAQTINVGDDKACGWQRMNNDGRYMLSGNNVSTSAASPYQFTMNIFAWEEDACGADDTYNDDCFVNDDDHPASTSTTVTLDPSTMNLGYNAMDINWSGNGAQYGLRLEWELLSAPKIVTLYSDGNLSGRTQDFGAGDYNVNALFTGVGNDNVSSMQIASGYKVITYNNGDYIGYPVEFRGTVNLVGGPNDRISSFQVVPDTGPPSTDKTLFIYFNGSGKSLEFQLQRFATQVNADQMIFIKGVGGETKNYSGYNQDNLQYREEEEINQYDGFDAFNPFPTTFYSTVKVFKNNNHGGGFDRYFFGVDMDYDGSVTAGYEDEDSYTAAANVLRVLRRYNLKGYSRIVISGHSRGSAVGISSFLHGMKKAIEADPQFAEFQGLVNTVFGSATTINVVALDPVAGANTPGLRNDYHMGDDWRAREIYQWLKGHFSNINFSEIYANGGRMLESDEIAGLGGFLSSNTFDPSPNYLHVEPSNNVQRYWLGYRHSSMVNKEEKWSFLYDLAGIPRPWLHTAAMLNAAFYDQSLFRNHQHWYDIFHTSDQLAWLQALDLYGCTDSPSSPLAPLVEPDADLEFQHYHGTRHTNFDNSDDSPVNMDDFVGNNNIKFHCSDESKIPANAALYEASNSYTDNAGWTHYCSCQGKRLLSLKLAGTGANIPNNGVSFKESNTNYFAPAGTGFITNPNGAVLMSRSWNVNPTTQPNSNVGVRFYFRASDYDNINTHLTILRNKPPLSSVNQLFFYKATSGNAHADIANIPTANLLQNGPTASTTNWLLGSTLRGEYYAEYQVASFSGGGGGGNVPSDPVSLTCPTNTTVNACQTQAAVNAAFATWLATATANGGCNGTLTNNNTGAPSACGGSTTVTFTYTSDCAPLTTTCQATFTVTAAPTVALTCPSNTTVAACQTQAAVNTAFATWLATATANGGCNGTLTNNNTGAPSACGGSTTVTFTYTSTCAPLTTTCQATFTVTAPATVVLTCPTNTTAAACQTQAAVNTAFATWLASASASGGCNGALTNNNTGAPSACGGSTTVTFTYTSTCAPLTTTCQATFTVTAAPTVVLTCPTNTTVAACQTQTAVNAAFATWLATATASGGCNGALTNNNTGAPSACGGSTTVTFTYSSTCAPLSTTCQATFTVTAPATVALICPTNTTVTACQTQAAVNTAFATWLATATANGGCNGTLTNNNTGAPSACGGSTTVTFSYTSTCAPLSTTCQATFTVIAAPTVVLTCPSNTTANACQTQATVNTAFATWLATATASGGCNGTLTNNNTGAPSACGGSTTVTFTYTSTCAPLTTTCQATFTVTAAPTVVLTCPTNTTLAACQTQAAVNTAFATWLATATANGGCNGVLTNNNTGAPSACGGSTTVTFTYTSTCAPLTTTCQATFTVTAPATVALTCPTNTTVNACKTQTAVNAAFATWLATATANGGCNGVLTNNSTGAPSACGGSTTVTFTYTSDCAPLTTTCQATFTVTAAPTVALTCPTPTTVAAGQTQVSVNAAFATWLATAGANGGCNGVLTNDNTGAPNTCGGSTTVTFTYTSSCEPFTTTCKATFTVAGTAISTAIDFLNFSCKDSVLTLSSTINGGVAPYTYHWTQNGGAGVLQITNNNDGTATAKGTTAGKVYVEFNVTDTNGCTAAANVEDSLVVVDCTQFSLTNHSARGDNFMIGDPCTCKGNGLFEETVWIEPTQAGQSWTVVSIAPALAGGIAPQGISAGDALSYNAMAGIHSITFDHVDSSGFVIVVEGPNLPGTVGNTFLTIDNICYYPDVALGGLPVLVSPNAAPFVVTGTAANNANGIGTFTLNGVPQAGVSPAPTVLTINPANLPLGTNTLTYRFDADTAGSKNLSDPGCVKTITQSFRVAHCGCQNVTVSLDANCQFLLTGNLVSDANCGGGTVRVMDNNPGNGNIIDCAGVWTYGLFDAFGNIICWGKVTAEDKTAPLLVCAPADFTLDCYDVNYVLNNRLTIGNVKTTSSPRPSATSNQTILNAEGIAGTGDNCNLGLIPPGLVADNILNLGYAYFKDNCYTCGCRITLKWTDKVEFYSCEQTRTNGGYYATIFREWVATDCNGMRTSYVQKIRFVRPELDDFVFNGPGEGKYDRVVTYNFCTPDKSLIKKEEVTPYVCSYFNTSANPRCLFIDQVECNYSVTIKDTEFPICGGKGVKIDRELYVFDWCRGGIVDTFHILIKIGDFEAPTLEYAHHAPFDISTGPMDCTAAIPVTVTGIKSQFGVSIKDNCTLANLSVSVKTKDRYVKGILVAENVWEKVDYAVMNGLMIGLSVGRHRLIVDASDGCYNTKRDSFEFNVVDKIAPVMKCDDDLHVTLSNANGYTSGYAQVSADDIDEGSWDNCKLAWIAVRRNIPDACAASFIAKGYDTNGNGKLDALGADNDYSKADGFDLNGDGDIADFGETFILKGGKLMTPLADFVEFFCCDLTERVTVELWGGDTSGNTNYCWMDLLIEDKVAPTCIAPWDVTIFCDDKNIAQIDNKLALAKIFGDVTIPTGNDCAALDTVYSTVKSLKCGAGYIDRIWTLTKQTVKGPITITCKQRINILPLHEYNICFPKDIATDCKTPVIDTVLTDELACDILAVNVSDKRYDASDDECYKIFRTYTVINWCVYDDRYGDPMAEGHVYVVDRATFGNYGKAPLYVLVRDANRDLTEEFYLSKDLIAKNADDLAFKPPYCEINSEFYHSFMYTQIIKVYDDTRPVVTGLRDTFCTSSTLCTANITKVIKITDNCTDRVELETQFLMIAPFQTTDAGKMILYSTPRWSVTNVGGGIYNISVTNLPEGTHDLIVVGRDECGNLNLPTRIPFTVKDCKAPAPICINGLSTELMSDGNGGGMMAVWASDFVASKIYDCNGQGPETLNGLKLITKYSINRVGQPVVSTQTGINLTCADKGKVVLVELHAWDNAGNHDFCVTYIEVQDNRAVCQGSATETVNIAGTIATEGKANLQGATITLSGAASQSTTTPANGGYSFINLAQGGDFTVTPQLDKNHLNGVSTFDLVLIQKHILGVQALNSPYKMIAADVNNSKSISTLDIIQLRKLILNIDSHFANNTSWRFVDASYIFPQPTNPWSTAFPEVVSVNDIANNVIANFIAIKVGDVNASATVGSVASAEIRTNGHFEFNTREQSMKAGNEYKVTFKAADLKNIQGYQFALNLDQSKVELLDIEYGVAKAENFGLFKNEGLITTSWNSKYEPGTLFTLILRAKADGKLSQSLSLNRLVHPEAYDQNNENLSIKLTFQGEQISDSYELKQNTPNPFNAETNIGFSLPKAMKVTLTVRDVKGALIYKVEGNYTKGNNQVTLKKEQLGASGVLYYTLETNDFTATKKMIILQ